MGLGLTHIGFRWPVRFLFGKAPGLLGVLERVRVISARLAPGWLVLPGLPHVPKRGTKFEPEFPGEAGEPDTWGTRGGHVGDTWGTRGGHVGDTWGTRGGHVGDTWGTRGGHVGDTWGTRGGHVGDTWGTRGGHVGDTWGTRGGHVGDTDSGGKVERERLPGGIGPERSGSDSDSLRCRSN